MTATLIPFPCDRMAGKTRRLALMIYDGTFLGRFPGRSEAHARAYSRRLKADLRKSMEKLGIDAATIDRELLAFTMATVDEVRRLCRESPYDEGRRVTPHDGGGAA